MAGEAITLTLSWGVIVSIVTGLIGGAWAIVTVTMRLVEQRYLADQKAVADGINKLLEVQQEMRKRHDHLVEKTQQMATDLAVTRDRVDRQ